MNVPLNLRLITLFGFYTSRLNLLLFINLATFLLGPIKLIGPKIIDTLRNPDHPTSRPAARLLAPVAQKPC